MTNRTQLLKCFALVGGIVAVWAFAVCRVLVGVSPDYAAREPGAGLTRVTAYLAAGFVVGLMLAAAARLGSRPKRSAASLIAPTLLTLGLTTALIAAGAVAGAVLHGQQAVSLPDDLAEQVPARKHGALIAAMGGHAAFATLFPAAGVMAGAVYLSRGAPRRLSIPAKPQTTKG